jgi:NADH dehydrogenase
MILVTGATGFIGRSLARSLDHASLAWRPYSGRINAPLDLRAQLTGVEVVIHLAGSEARGRKRLLQHVDIEGTQRLLEEAQRAGVQRLIFPSRLNADPFAIHALLRCKGEVERLIQRSGISYTIVRSATLFGRDDRFSEIITGLALWSWPLAWVPGGGKVAMQPLWVEDYVRCLLATLERPDLINRTIAVAGAELLSYREIVKTVLASRGLRRAYFPLPGALLRPTAALSFNWWYWPAVSRFFVDRFFVPEVTNLDAVPRQFGFQPVRFRDAISYINRRGLRWRIFRH